MSPCRPCRVLSRSNILPHSTYLCLCRPAATNVMPKNRVHTGAKSASAPCWLAAPLLARNLCLDHSVSGCYLAVSSTVQLLAATAGPRAFARPPHCRAQHEHAAFLPRPCECFGTVTSAVQRGAENEQYRALRKPRRRFPTASLVPCADAHIPQAAYHLTMPVAVPSCAILATCPLQ